ncbi:aldo/keto reductase [Robertkochia flava]|uniref:aldo/keto reductase n=1 Tax=Robertkochia flava TaxID=3447986 RepID=UPI001CCB3A5E|nr:aldo/keto reductase [Robertkochia marina]
MTFSKIIAGTMTWGSWGKNLSTAQMTHLINYCVEKGITTFDHADIYGGYTTEADFGKALKKSPVKREDIQLISKCGIQYMADTRDNRIKHYDLSEDYIVWSAEQSLKNLGTDYLDLFLLHRPSPLMEPGAIAAAAERLKKEGKIKSLGVSNFTPSQTDLIRSKIPLAANQIQFSATHFESMLNGDLDHMILHGIQPMAWSPLGSVFREDTPQTQRIRTLMFELIEKYKATADQLLLAWIMKHPAGIIPVIGTTNPERISNALKATNIDLELQDWFAIQVASQGHKVP